MLCRFEAELREKHAQYWLNKSTDENTKTDGGAYLIASELDSWASHI